MTQEQLAKKLRMSRQKLSRLLNCPDKMELGVYKQILNILGYSLPDYLIKAH